jgi:hypothetical protein
MRKLSFKPGWVVSLIALVSLSVMSVQPLLAQEDLERPPPIPLEGSGDVPIPPKIQQEQIEPTVTIREEEGSRIEEYRLDGQVYMVKVTPEGGIPYYYMDNDGDGRLELDITQSTPNPVQPVYWKVGEWK